jgi:hypothetical protein
MQVNLDVVKALDEMQAISFKELESAVPSLWAKAV